MIRAVLLAIVCCMIVGVCAAVGRLVHWDWAWLLIVLPASLALAFSAADAAVDHYLWWKFKRAVAKAEAYRNADVWDITHQTHLNISAKRASERLR